MKNKEAVKEFYKSATGSWVIDLKDGYSTCYGTNYIENKTKKQCLYELDNCVTKNN